MVLPDPRRILQRLLTSLFQAGEPATVVLATATIQAGDPTPGESDTQPERNLEERADQAVATLVEAAGETRDGDSWVRNWLQDAELELIAAGKDGFRNGGFLNGGGGGGGGFRNGGFVNGGGGGGFRNGGFRNGGGGGGFRNSRFRNF